MKKSVIAVVFCALLAGSIYLFALLNDQQALEQELVRLHVVAASDEKGDQAIKLRVRDAVLASIREGMEDAADASQAKAYLQQHLQEIEQAANDALYALGCSDRAAVTLCREKFEKRIYDTFSLPAGIYESLRITIGEGKGHNWWCVAFPELCLPAASREVETLSRQAGLSRDLAGAMTGRYELRFYLLDLLGRLKCKYTDGWGCGSTPKISASEG